MVPNLKGKMQVDGIRGLLWLFLWLLFTHHHQKWHLLSIYHVPDTIIITFQILNHRNSFCLSNFTGLITCGTIIDPNGLFLFLIKSRKEVEVWISCKCTDIRMDLFIREYELRPKKINWHITSTRYFKILISYFILTILLICSVLNL